MFTKTQTVTRSSLLNGDTVIMTPSDALSELKEFNIEKKLVNAFISYPVGKYNGLEIKVLFTNLFKYKMSELELEH